MLSDLIPLFGGAAACGIVVSVLGYLKQQRRREQEAVRYLHPVFRRMEDTVREITHPGPPTQAEIQSPYYTPVAPRLPKRAPGGIVRGPLVNFGITADQATEALRVVSGKCPHRDNHEVQLSDGTLAAWICKGCGKQRYNTAYVYGLQP